MLLLVGAGIVDESKLPACPDGIEMSQWVLLCTIGERIESLAALPVSIAKDPKAWRALYDQEAPGDIGDLPDPIGGDITPFQRLLLVKAFRPEKIVECIVSATGLQLASIHLIRISLPVAMKAAAC